MVVVMTVEDSDDRVVVVLHSGERENAWSSSSFFFFFPPDRDFWHGRRSIGLAFVSERSIRSSSSLNVHVQNRAKFGASEDASRASAHLTCHPISRCFAIAREFCAISSLLSSFFLFLEVPSCRPRTSSPFRLKFRSKKCRSSRLIFDWLHRAAPIHSFLRFVKVSLRL